MKFLSRINRNYFVLLTVILLTVTISGYFILHVIILRSAKEKLIDKADLIEKQISDTGEIPELPPVIEVFKEAKEPDLEPSFVRITLRNQEENEDEVYLEYTSKVKIDKSWYIIKLRQSAFENEDLIFILALALFVLLSSVLVISFFITRRINRTILAGFDHNLREMESFNLIRNEKLSLLQTGTDEFDRMNRVVSALTEKLRSDYITLKEFTENASHEIQTPLSVALVNLEEMLQEDPGRDNFLKITAATGALRRLSSLNQSLLLLAKLDNRQFDAGGTISLAQIASRKINELSVLFETKQLVVTTEINDDFMISMNEQLGEILINNLLSNAIKHNITGGFVRIRVSPGLFSICNTGVNNLLDDNTVFNRFKSGNSGSSGLGLAIVKKICEIHNLAIHYRKDDLHCFEITPENH